MIFFSIFKIVNFLEHEYSLNYIPDIWSILDIFERFSMFLALTYTLFVTKHINKYVHINKYLLAKYILYVAPRFGSNNLSVTALLPLT